jgi:hypothetical protein
VSQLNADPINRLWVILFQRRTLRSVTGSSPAPA